MLNQALINPKSIVVVGASQNHAKPGGHLLYNLLQTGYKGELYSVHPYADEVQGVKTFNHLSALPDVELAILAIPASVCNDAVQLLAEQKHTRAFIVISAGFAESGALGQKLENELVATVNHFGSTLVGPNCIGVISPNFAGVFTEPIPPVDPESIDFISGSGATAVFIIEAGMKKGLRFSSVFSVGNSAQTGVEEVLEYLDESYDPKSSAPVKLLYMESISNPRKLLKHARSLVQKGCRIGAVKAGISQSGARAAQSHTGAMLSSDQAVDALFKKAGMIRCKGREELTNLAALLLLPPLPGNRLAIITHAGGPAVMLTDELEKVGFEIPRLKDSDAKQKLKKYLFEGASVENPIDFLATGTAEQLGHIIDACEQNCPEVDGMVVIFGSPGLGPVSEVYQLLTRKMETCSKPIFPVLPSVVNAEEAIREFIQSGKTCFTDELGLARALELWRNRSIPKNSKVQDGPLFFGKVFQNVESGFLDQNRIHQLLTKASIPHLEEIVVHSEPEATIVALEMGFPLVLKVVGPLHKSDVGGVRLNIGSDAELRQAYRELMQLDEVVAVSVSPMRCGTELFIGAKREGDFPPLILFGAGGIWLEALHDVKTLMVPLTIEEVVAELRKLKAYSLFAGSRGQQPIDEKGFAQLICRLSKLMEAEPRILEMDLNPVLATGNNFIAVDARIKFQ